MTSIDRAPARLVALLAVLSAGACQGNIGNSFPQAPQIGGLTPNPGANSGTQPRSRQRTAEQTTQFAPDAPSIEFPPSEGFRLSLTLGTAPPAIPSAAGSGSPGPRAGSAASAVASGGPSSAAPPSAAAPLAPPTVSPTVAPVNITPAATSASANAGAANSKPSASPTGPRLDLKLTIFPEDVPSAPPAKDGTVRHALVRGYLLSGQSFEIFGLGAFRFTIPAAERLPSRSYSVAMFEQKGRNDSPVALFAQRKQKKNPLLRADVESKEADGVVRASGGSGSIALRKGQGYIAVLYASDVPPTPGPSPATPAAGGFTAQPLGSTPTLPAGATQTPFGMPTGAPSATPSPPPR